MPDMPDMLERKTIKIAIADYAKSSDGDAIIELMNQYSLDKMGGGEALPDSIKKILVAEMAKIPGAFTVIAFVENPAVSDGSNPGGLIPVGLINCFMGFSTFKAKPLINIHDVVVLPEYRGLKLSTRMLEKVEEIAIERGCCKLTLEVLEGNKIAQNAYLKFGFGGYELDPELGGAGFWEKVLQPYSLVTLKAEMRPCMINLTVNDTSSQVAALARK